MVDLIELLGHHLVDHTYFHIPLGTFSIPVTKHTLFLLGISIGISLLILWASRKASSVPSGIYNFIEIYVLFVRDNIVAPSIGHGFEKYLNYFLTLFLFILISNFAGLIPGSVTVTSNVGVTAALALCTLFVINFAGIKEQGLWGYVKSFVPHGVPVAMVPMVFVLEVFGLFIRCMVLCVRLFANMVAGHAVMLLFFALVFLIGSMFIAPVSIGVVIFVMFIELLVAFLQAYIFTMLSAIFVGLVVHAH